MTMSGNQRRHTGGYWLGGVKKTVDGLKRKQWLWLTGEPLPNIQLPWGGNGIHGPECAAYYKLKPSGSFSIHPSIVGDKCDEKRPGYICQFYSNLL